MNCPNCKNEVMPEWMVCPFCGYNPVKCSNPKCGHKDWLPTDARFCPACGKALEINHSPVKTETPPKATPKDTTPQNTVPKDSRDLFFPLNGLTLGKTTMADVRKKHLEIDNLFGDEETFRWPHEATLLGIHCGRKTDEKYVNHMFLMDADYPPEWKERLHVSFASSSDEWMKFFRKHDFSVNKRRNQTYFLKGTDTVSAVSSDEKLHFNLLFYSQNDCLSSIAIDYDKTHS